ncbi:MAG: hypothetical protein ABSA23_17150 [Anaerolineales bacterium]|jgi:predicted  nucleic acid-binding Zn-ribbon protein
MSDIEKLKKDLQEANKIIAELRPELEEADQREYKLLNKLSWMNNDYTNLQKQVERLKKGESK